MRIDGLAIANGFANRFLFVWSRLTQLLPYGGDIDRVAVTAVADRIDAALSALQARIQINGTMHLPLDPGARARWTEFYNQRRTGAGEGIAKALSARHVAHAARLATIYAVLDGSITIKGTHVDAAIAWCDYSIGSTEKAFVGRIAGKAGKLLEAVRESMPDGLDGAGIKRAVSHNWAAGELGAAGQLRAAPSPPRGSRSEHRRPTARAVPRIDQGRKEVMETSPRSAPTFGPYFLLPT